MRRIRVPLLVAAVIAAGALVLARSVAGLQGGEAGQVAAVTAAAFGSGLLIVELSSVSAEAVTFALVAAGLLGIGPAASVIAAVAGEVGSALRPPRTRLHRSAYNAAAHALAAAALAVLFGMLQVRPDVSLATAALLLPGSLIYFGVSSGLVACAIGWSSSSFPGAVWVRTFRWLAPHYPALAVVGIALAQGQRVAGSLGILIFCLPLLMSHYSVQVFVRRTGDQMRALEEANTRLDAVNSYLTETLASVVDARDLYLYRHSHQASVYTEKIARRLALPEEEVQLVKQGALLHDIGKVAIPESILRKPGPLDDGERSIMNSHSEIGAEIVERTRELAPVAAIVRAHHERFDGAGYPDRLAGSRIPVGARILAVLEAFDAMISDRPYRKAMDKAVALAEISRFSGSQFDPRVVGAFLAVVAEEGMEWLTNSASDATVSGEDLFLPKGLLREHGHRHVGPVEDEREQARAWCGRILPTAW